MVRNLGYALGAIPLISIFTTSNAYTIDRRGALLVSNTLPGSWVSQGCWVDVGRSLTQGGYDDNNAMTEESCITYCSNAGYIYAGTEYSSQCYCGNSLANPAGQAASTDCSMPCTGNATEQCGGPNRLNLFWSGTYGPQTNPGPTNWTFSGCYTEGTTGRALTNGVTTTGGSNVMTVALCLSACQAAGYPLAGVEYSGECYCGNSIANGGALNPGGLSGCNMLCNGNHSEFCGGSGTLDVYDYKKEVSLPPWNTTTTTATTLSSSSSSSSVATTTSSSSSSSVSSTSASSTSSSSTSTSSLPLASASSSTSSSSFSSTISSSQSSSQSTSSLTTTTGSTTTTTSSTSASSTSTSTSHSSSSTSTSSPSSTSTSTSHSSSSTSTSSPSTSTSTSHSSSSTSTSVSSSVTANVALVASATTLGLKPTVGAYTYIGCWTEATNSRALSSASFYDYGAMTLEECAADCVGYNYFGVEYGGECYCGNSPNAGSVYAPNQGDCSFVCPGNQYEYCGAGNRLEMYELSTLVTSSSVSASSTSSSVSSSSVSTSSGTASTTSSSSSHSSTSTSSGTASSGSSTTSTSATASATVLGLKPVVGAYTYIGCYTEATNTRALSSASFYDYGAMTLEECATDCAGYTHFGVEYGGECYCGNTLGAGSIYAPNQADCSFTCPGNPYEYCGAGNRLEMYELTSLVGGSSSSVSSSSTSVSSSASHSTTTTGSSSTGSSSSVSSSSGPTSTTGSSVSSTGSSATASATVLGIKNTVGAYAYQGCYTEATNGRALSAASFYDYTAMTLEECAADCAAYTYFGVEYGGECYCGNTINAGSVYAPNQGDCSFVCPGNALEYCGAGNRLEMYARGASVVSSSSASGTATTATGSSTSASISVTTPSATGFPTGWTYQGCYVDGLTGRDLEAYQAPDSQTLTQQSCVALCASKGYTIAGMEYSVQCFCDNALYNGAALATNQADCSDACSGNSAEMCGGGNRLTLYSLGTPTVYEPPAAQQSGLPTGWTYQGCLQDNIASNEDPNEILSTFPYMAWNNATGNTPTACIEQCQQFGYNAAGLEYGSQCFCGDVENIQVASAPAANGSPDGVQYYTRSRVPQEVAASQCNSVCSGDPLHLCGSGNLLTWYAYTASPGLYEWDFPTGNAAGEYSLLIGGVVVPLMTSVVVTGKVTFTEKYGTGEPNGTGAYELDLSQINNFDAAWRTMTGLETDVFCSAGLTLPDKAGRQITIGGWAGQSNFGVRLYWPDGSAGVPGTNEWQEDPGVLSLQVPRWYPSAMILANGSMLIVGGEIGSNDAEQPTLEILPATGVPEAGTTSGYSNTTVYLDFLQRTAPFNLYPFICVVPSGIFIAYYNEARILDEHTFETIKTLPNMPAAVNDPTGGRTYQLEGSMVLLPQYGPAYDNLGVLICGGSTSNGGYALDNCISTVPEDDNPTWLIERMPSRRVMPCMAGLPDGTYLILNGAQHGVAGFELGDSPNYNAVLYDPTKNPTQRMSVMANTSVARLYHSEAIVLLDGRVIVSGSDPTGDYTDPAGEWPEEYRVEVFTPPYLLSGLPQPTFTLSSTDWNWGEHITITVTSGAIPAGSLKVSMLGSVVSTHGNAMGQRTIFPEIIGSGSSFTIVAPPDAYRAPPGWFMVFVLNGPTPSVGQFIRIGKDPAGFGNWPANLPAFQPLPGV